MKRVIKELGSFAQFIRDEQNRKTIMMIIMSVVLLTSVSMLKNHLSGAKYIRSGNGTVQGVMRDDTDETVSFPLRIEADIEGRKETKDVTLTVSGDSVTADTGEGRGDDSKTLFEAEISELMSKLSKEGGRRIMLPSSLSDGTELIWRKGRSGTELTLILMAPFLIWLLYVNGERKKRELKREKISSVERDLPAFNDQLLLLMGSGLIFREAFMRIAEGYRKRVKKSWFENEIVGIEDEVRNGVSDIVSVMTRKAETMGVSQFSRLAGIIRDNQLKGFDISGKLKNEAELLWDLRKRNAEERGRLAETRLTMPLALLLLVLVLVTAAPAIIQVEGG